jgi:hypothetical protein
MSNGRVPQEREPGDADHRARPVPLSPTPPHRCWRVADARPGSRRSSDTGRGNHPPPRRGRAFLSSTGADYDRVLAVNLKAVFFASQALVCHLRAAGRPGRIVNVSSIHEDLPFPGYASYAASKGGVRMLTRTLAVELRARASPSTPWRPGRSRRPSTSSCSRTHAGWMHWSARSRAGGSAPPRTWRAWWPSSPPPTPTMSTGPPGTSMAASPCTTRSSPWRTNGSRTTA